jgi:hypothetical protein
MKDVIISDELELEDKIKRMAEDGVKKLHVLADFDRTLTKAFVDGQKASTVIAQIRNGSYLTEDYAPEAHRLFDVYHPIEIDPGISSDEKNSKMQEWWQKHFELLIHCGLDKKVMEEIVKTRTLRFREREH